jgi:hypothetical protein
MTLKNNPDNQSDSRKSSRDKEMSAIMNMFAEPTYLRFFSAQCSYCAKRIDDAPDGSARAGPDLAVLACTAHGDLAKRDARAYMHKRRWVERYDVLDDPVFEALGFVGAAASWKGSPLKNLTVRRSNGALEPGWNFSRLSSSHDPLALQRSDDGHWMMPAEGPGGISKRIRVDDFTLSLPADKHHLVAAFIARLNTIYKADADAHDAARA